jgi:hypothetical protein
VVHKLPGRAVNEEQSLKAIDIVRFEWDDLTFRNWHTAPDWARRQLHDWVWGMQQARDGEAGDGPNGAGAWLDERIALSTPSSLFQTFIGYYCREVVWTGSVVEDDRGMKSRLAKMGYPVDAFFGLFNTRHDIRGRGIGWIGANRVNRHVGEFDRGIKNIVIALFTTNLAAERHYRALGFRLISDIYVPVFDKTERLYMKGERPSLLGDVVYQRPGC